MLFVTLRSAAAEQVPKVLQVVEQTKRIRHKAGLESELHQYVLYDTAEKQKGAKRIVLDDSSATKSKYTPPNNLVVHLSKIEMPELQPKANASDKSSKKRDEKKAPPSPGLDRKARSTSPNTRGHKQHSSSSLSAPDPAPRSSSRPRDSPSSATFNPSTNTHARKRLGESSNVRGPDAKQESSLSPSNGHGSSIPPWSSHHKGASNSPPAHQQGNTSSRNQKPIAISAPGVVAGLFDRLW